MRLLRLSTKIIIVFALILLFTNFTKKKTYNCKRQNYPVEINQFEIIWEGDYNYDIKSGMYYCISYDENQLYVGMKTSDKVLKQKIMMGGLTFWIDTNARGKEQLGLTFPVPNNFPPFEIKGKKLDSQKRDNESKKTKDEIKDFNNRYINGLEVIDVIGFGGETEQITSYNINQDGINTLLHIDTTDFMYYFASIPLDLIFNEPNKYLNNPDELFSFSFNINGIERPESDMKGGGPSGRGISPGGGGGGGRPGGERPGGGTSPDMEQMQAMAQPTKFTIKKASLWSKK